jgi:peptide/nickel transport system ATP-binding protein/oligopeptide transport system ATP-binding protein
VTEPLLQILDLKTYFFTEEGIARAVDGMEVTIHRGQTLGVIGESGCGKSVTALSILQLIPRPPGKIVSGEIRFNGKDLLKTPLSEIRKIRGNDISMIFQEPMTSLNPVYTIGNQIMEPIRLHQGLAKADARIKAIEMLRLVGIPSPDKRVNEYPHQLSGGMRQRAMIAMALSCHPQLLIADEPTTALDVTIQAQILRLIKDIKDEIDMSVMMITHDLGVIAEVSDTVVVAYAGKAVESADVKAIFAHPFHPYTRGLYESIPKVTDARNRKLTALPGMVPNPLEFPTGCRFHPRCRFCKDVCREQEPKMVPTGEAHQVRCFMFDETTKHHFSNDERNTARS